MTVDMVITVLLESVVYFPIQNQEWEWKVKKEDLDWIPSRDTPFNPMHNPFVDKYAAVPQMMSCNSL